MWALCQFFLKIFLLLFFLIPFWLRLFGNKLTIPSRFATTLLCLGGKYHADAHFCSNKTITYFDYILFQRNKDVLSCRWTLCPRCGSRLVVCASSSSFVSHVARKWIYQCLLVSAFFWNGFRQCPSSLTYPVIQFFHVKLWFIGEGIWNVLIYP